MNTNKQVFGLCSDLHLEFGPLPDAFYAWRGDVLLLAGDLGESKTMRSESMKRFWSGVCEMAPNVLYITGNHEYYHGELDKEDSDLKSYLADNFASVQMLQNETVDHHGLKIFGSTFWTDFGHSPMSKLVAQNSLNDYRAIRLAKAGYRKINPNDVAQLHSRAMFELQESMRRYPESPFLVMTHHAPSLQSVHPDYVHRHDLNDAYASNLDQFVSENPQIQAWVHGHIHYYQDYVIEDSENPGEGCRVLCNPRGYTNERPGHLPDYTPLSFTLDY